MNGGKLTNWKKAGLQLKSVESCVLSKIKKFLDECTKVKQNDLVKISEPSGRSLQVVKKIESPDKAAKAVVVSPAKVLDACKKS